MIFNILIIDDDIEIPRLIQNFSQQENYPYNFIHVRSGPEMYEALRDQAIHLIIMDWQLGTEVDGIGLVKELRSKKSTQDIFILFFTGRATLEDELTALNSGADMYLSKPVDLEVMFAYINSFLRRINKDQTAQNILMRKFNFVDDSLEVHYMGELHKLTPKEYTILKTLVEHPGKTFSQRELNALSSGPKVFVTKRCIDTFITVLRNKIGKECILSIKKKGYTINPKLFE